MSRSRKLKPTAILLLLSLVLLLSPAPLPTIDEAEAATTRCGSEITYYADPGLTQVVGVYGWLPISCGCQSYSWGTFSPYKTVGDSYC